MSTDTLVSALPSNATDFGLAPGQLKSNLSVADSRTLQQQALVAFGRRTNAQPTLPILMQDAVALIGEVLDAEMGGVGEVVGDRITLTVGGRDAAGKTVAPQTHSCPLDEVNSMAAYALRMSNLTATTDARADYRFCDAFLTRLGLAGALVIPLHVNGKPFGVLGVYSRRTRQFNLDDITFAETIAHLLSASIARIKMEQKLQEARAIKSGMMEMLDTMVMTLDMDGRVIDMNRACQQLTKYSIEDVRDKPFWGALGVPEESDLIRMIFSGSRNSQVPSSFDGHVQAKDGTRHRVSWSLKVLSTGQIQTVLMTGTDQTFQIATKAEIQRVRQLAEQATTTLAQLCTRLESPKPDAETSAPAAEPCPDVEDEELDGMFQPTPTATVGMQQRRSPRRAYRYRQSIAPVDDSMMPMPKAFFEVECWDISACGLSFLMDRLPDFETLVVALGRAPALSHFTARVMRVARVEQNEQTRYLVGCRFLGRVHL
jgi:PAS domain S-box-containing protein